MSCNMFFDMLFDIINAKSITQKLQLLEEFTQISTSLLLSTPTSSHPPRTLTEPSYKTFCSIIHPTKIRRVKAIKSPQALAKVLHSIVHIEYSAIDLALDAMYRFRDLPLSFYTDWLAVALEEKLHFSLLRESLNALGYEYGDFPVHAQLFYAQKATLSLHERMALLHRGAEANGLDANPFLVAKIQKFEHSLTPQILNTLELILKDEITHVKKGDKWWRYKHNSANAQSFLSTLERFKSLYALPKILNIKARLMAGFSQIELDMLEQASKH
ncbi:ferritin-like domain-containing protein [Helicobacter marmotae]|nr:ferritin-like domain-containing protein [Helicobacter marmotae]